MAQATRKRPTISAAAGKQKSKKGATRKPAATKKRAAKKASSRVTSKSATSTRPAKTPNRAGTPNRGAHQRTLATATLANSVAIGQMARLLREVGAIVCVFAALIAFLALVSFDVDDPGWSHTGAHDVVANSVGRAGAWFADVAFYLLGFMAYLVPAILGMSAWLLFADRTRKPGAYRPFVFVRLIGVGLMLASASGLADLHFGVPDGALPRGTFGGGILGTAVAWRLVAYLHHLGTTLLLLALFFCSMTLAFGTSWLTMVESIGATIVRRLDQVASLFGGRAKARAERRRQLDADQARRARFAGAVPGATDALMADPASLPINADRRADRGGLFARLGAMLGMAGSAAQRLAEGSDSAEAAFAGGGQATRPRDADTAFAGQGADRRDAMARSMDASLTDSSVSPMDRALDASIDEADALFAPRRASSGKTSTDTVVATAGDGAHESPDGTTAGRAARHAASTDEALGETNAAMRAASASPVAPLSEPSAVREKKIAIRERVHNDERQAKLYLDVPDSDLPPLSLLDAPEPMTAGFSEEDLRSLSLLLEEKLREFKIEVEVVAVQPGPVITRFEMQLAPGIKASRVTGLSQDLARSLSLTSVRVVEVIAGRSTIGIEVPNRTREMVVLSEMLMSEQFAKQKSALTLAIGKDISGAPVMADIARMPHLLVAGTTGAGKSVAINSMLISLLYKSTAKDVRLILIDPKVVELNVYDGIPHLLTPVVTDMSEAANALRWCVNEMERRIIVMGALKVRNITSYNRKIRDAEASGEPLVDPLWEAALSLNPTGPPPLLEPMPLIVVVVDEFADMMMQVGKKAEELIARIAQKARAAGIHLILATQRPSVDVITGLIKANVPTRIAFKVSTKIDSRTIIDQGGAETLLGHGDMLYQAPGSSVTQRVHGAFIDDHEVLNVVAYLKTTGEPQYIEAILQENQGSIPGLSGGEDSSGEQDALYDQAVAIVCETRRASISFVQRKLKIGYNRAARMIEEMEAAGVVTPDMNGKREVLAPPPV